MRLTLTLTLKGHYSNSKYIAELLLRLCHHCYGCCCPYICSDYHVCSIFVRNAFFCYCVTVVSFVSAVALTVTFLVSVLPLHFFIGNNGGMKS